MRSKIPQALKSPKKMAAARGLVVQPPGVDPVKNRIGVVVSGIQD